MTARYISQRLGTKTIQTASRSEPGGFGWATKTTGYAPRELLLPEDVRQLKDTRAIIFKEGHRPTLGKKIRYFQNRELKRRVLPPADVPSLDLTPPVAPTITTIEATSKIAGADNTATDDPGLDLTTQSEVIAMGQSIANLMINDTDPAAIQARAELLAALSEEAER